MHDVTAQEPKLLVHLKATRNTVPVPRHWCFKRKYLQGKRGIEKPPFELPEFIRRTGIQEMREALQEKVGVLLMVWVNISRNNTAWLVILFFCPLAGGCQNYENQNEREGSSQDGKDRHRLPETPRCFLQMANQAQAHHPRRPLLWGTRSLAFLTCNQDHVGTFIKGTLWALKLHDMTYFVFLWLCRVKSLKLVWKRRNPEICLMSCVSLWACQLDLWVSLLFKRCANLMN